MQNLDDCNQLTAWLSLELIDFNEPPSSDRTLFALFYDDLRMGDDRAYTRYQEVFVPAQNAIISSRYYRAFLEHTYPKADLHHIFFEHFIHGRRPSGHLMTCPPFQKWLDTDQPRPLLQFHNRSIGWLVKDLRTLGPKIDYVNDYRYVENNLIDLRSGNFDVMKKNRILTAFYTLGPKEQKVLLKLYEGYSKSSIAEDVGVSNSTITRIVSKIRRVFENCLD